METPELIFQLSEADEQIIRTYECTRFKRWFSKPTIGYLTITNRRIIFHSSGKSITGKSLLINEMPLEDAAGVNVYEGFSMNWWLFVIFAVVAYLVTQFVVSAFPSLFANYWLSIFLLIPYGVIWLFSSNVLNEQTKEQVFQSIEKQGRGHVSVNRDISSYLPIVRLLFFVGVAAIGWQVAFGGVNSFRRPIEGWILLLIVYAFIFISLSGGTHTFSLLIGSRTMKGSGIFIPGDSMRLLATRDITALQALGASPASDASLVTKELGALLLDIQQLGDLGIEKWKR